MRYRSPCWELFVCSSLLLSVASAHAEVQRPEILRHIAFGSCADQNRPQPIWDAVLAKRPDLFIFVGDNIYADTEDMELMRAKYAKLAAKPGYQKLLETCPVLATWDDHDYGANDAGAWYPKKAESAQIMLDFFGVPADSPRRQRDCVYGAYRFGPEGRRVQVILLDTRYFKSRMKADTRSREEKNALGLVGWYVPEDDPTTTILGDEQWAWLEQQVKQPADVRIIASSIQVIAHEKGMESWGNFPHERHRLYDLITKAGAKGAFFISGDGHFSEVSRTDEGPYPLYDFTSSGLTNIFPDGPNKVNNFRVSQTTYARPTFGLIELDWDADPTTITFRACGLNDEVGLEMAVPLDELQ
jgi:alkaline phosphatase D